MAFSLENDFMLYAAPAGVRAGQKIYQRIGNFLLRRAIDRHAPLQRSIKTFFPVQYDLQSQTTRSAFESLNVEIKDSDAQTANAKKYKFSLPPLPFDIAQKPEKLGTYIDGLLAAMNYDVIADIEKIIKIPVDGGDPRKILGRIVLHEALSRAFPDKITNKIRLPPEIHEHLVNYMDSLGILEPLEALLKALEEILPDAVANAVLGAFEELGTAGIAALFRTAHLEVKIFRAGDSSIGRALWMGFTKFLTGTIGASAGGTVGAPGGPVGAAMGAGAGAMGAIAGWKAVVKNNLKSLEQAYRQTATEGQSSLKKRQAEIAQNTDAKARKVFGQYVATMQSPPDLRTNAQLIPLIRQFMMAYASDCRDAANAIDMQTRAAIENIEERKLRHKFFRVRWKERLTEMFNAIAEEKKKPWLEAAQRFESGTARNSVKLADLIPNIAENAIVKGGHVEKLAATVPELIPAIVHNYAGSFTGWGNQCVKDWNAAVIHTDQAMQAEYNLYDLLFKQFEEKLKKQERTIRGDLRRIGVELEPKAA